MSIPEWCRPLFDAETMRSVDRWAIEERGEPSLQLMERAGLGASEQVERLVPDGLVVVVCGKGNNGGDGLVIARLLREHGRAVRVICTAQLAELSGDARVNLERLPGESAIAPDPHGKLDLSALGDAEVIVDALLGTGFQGKPRGRIADAIEGLRSAGAPIVSIDVPSGVDASTGVVEGPAVRATITVTFHASKPGLWIHPGKAHAGEIREVDIGIPRGAPSRTETGLIEPAVLRALPHRAANSTKFSSGHVVLVGGSRGLTGAPGMAARAAMRAGAGYVTACVPSSVQSIVASQGLLEVMTRGLADDEQGGFALAAVPDVLEAAERAGALALGPGLGRSEGAFAFARELARRAPLALVLDADGLNAHASRLEDLAARAAPTVLTPHAGELGRLLGLDSEQIEAERLRHVRAAAAAANAVVVLKGDDTLVADPRGTVAVNPGGSPALATAGTGDVLTGVISALLAQGLEPFTAACAGVYLHARAGLEAARRLGGPDCVIASDVIASLPVVRDPGVGG